MQVRGEYGTRCGKRDGDLAVEEGRAMEKIHIMGKKLGIVSG
jgi:hypothetical protein